MFPSLGLFWHSRRARAAPILGLGLALSLGSAAGTVSAQGSGARGPVRKLHELISLAVVFDEKTRVEEWGSP